MSKEVYVLGAGFSVPAGMPPQKNILSEIINFDTTTLSDSLKYLAGEFLENRDKITKFLGNVFPGVDDPSLEDIFTLLDLSISKRQYCAGYTWQQLLEIRDGLRRAIIVLLHAGIANCSESARAFYRDVAVNLIERRLRKGQQSDPFTVIELNWDTLLEVAIFDVLRRVGGVGKVDVDYCCYSDALPDTPHTPSITQKAIGIFNLKLQKLHGSINWLLCPNCERLFTAVGNDETIGPIYAGSRPCPKCEKVWNKSSSAHNPPNMEHFIVTPTYTKVFDNTHIQLIWHNASVDLFEAEKIVFIGYSLPEADYHVRALLRRSIRESTKIIAVLADQDKIPSKRRSVDVNNYAEARYQKFFGKERVTVYTGGVKKYFDENEPGFKSYRKRAPVVGRRLKNPK